MSAQNIKCLIAGGASFIGKNLAEALLFHNCKVITIDDLTHSSKDNIQHLKDNPQFTFIKGNINKGFPEEIKDLEFDAVYHLAGVEDHSLDKNINLDTLRTNALGTINLLELAKESRARFLFASSIEVYLGLLSSLNLDNYFGATEKEQKKYSLAEAKRFGEALIWEYRKKYGVNARIVRLGEVYGPGMDLKSSGSLGRFLEEVSKNEALNIHGDGLKKEYYSHIRDIVFGLYQGIFAKNTAGKIYPLTNLNAVTELELAYLIQNLVKPKPDIIFKPPLKEVEVPDLKIIDGQLQKDLNWEPKVPLKEGIRETLESLQVQLEKEKKEIAEKETKKVIEKKSPIKLSEKAKRIAKATKNKLEKGTRSKVKERLKPVKNFNSFGPVPKLLALGSALLIITTTILPFAETGFWAYRGWKQLNTTKQNLLTLNTEKAIKESQKAEEYLQKAQNSFARTYWIYAFLNKNSTAVQTEKLIHAAKTTASAVNNTTYGLEELKELTNIFTKNKDKETQIDFREVNLNFGQAKRKLQLAEAEIKEIETGKLPKLIKSRLVTNKELLTKLTKKVDTLQNASKILPTALGFEEPQTCLILLQNSNELRATGGFIGSYGELTLNKAKIEQLKIDDIYNPDGELDKKEIIITPPQPLKDHLKVTNWRMRDSNWAVDFPTSAKAAQEFYYLATGVNTQCVIGIDLFLIENLLKITGPLKIEDFDETITANNLFEKTEFIVEAEYKPGSDKKTTFLSALGTKLLNNIFNIEEENLINMLKAMENALKEKHLLIYHNNININNILNEENWNGAVADTTGDYLYTVDANLGATKSNYFVERKQKLEILNIDRQGTIENTLTLTYIHTGKNNTWPGGPYDNYLRILVPKGSWLKRATKTTNAQDQKGENITDQIVTGGEAGKTTFETFFTLNAGQSTTLTFTYRVPDSVYKPLSTTEYSLYVQKQPGTAKDSFHLEFVIPFGKNVTAVPEDFRKIGKIMKLEKSLLTDLNIKIPLE